MFSEVKLILQNGVNADKLHLAGNNLEGKRELFPSENDKFMINSLNVNIDTNDATNHYKNYTDVMLDLTQGRIKYVYQNLKKSEDKLEVEKENLKATESILNSTEYKEWKEITPYLLTFHVNFKEDVFGLKQFNIARKYNLAFMRQDDSILK